MKKLTVNLIMILALVVSISSCKEDKKENATAEEATTETVEKTVEETKSTEVEKTTETSEESDEVTEEEEGLDKETVTVTYTKVVNGVEIKSEKTFSGGLEQVEARVKAFEDSLKKVDSNIKIIRQ